MQSHYDAVMDTRGIMGNKQNPKSIINPSENVNTWLTAAILLYERKQWLWQLLHFSFLLGFTPNFSSCMLHNCCTVALNAAAYCISFNNAIKGPVHTFHINKKIKG